MVQLSQGDGWDEEELGMGARLVDCPLGAN
jgi:hypothetical protein